LCDRGISSPTAGHLRTRATEHTLKQEMVIVRDRLLLIMEAHEPVASPDELPQSVITSVLEVLLHQTNPSQVLKLAVCSKDLYARVSNAEGLWKRTCELVGWHTKQAASYANVPQDDDMKWFTYYLIRMRVRWRIRRLMKLYIPILPRMCSMNIMPGVSIATLASVEQHLGAKLHWELWEMLR
jgi:hypothetical protein